MSGSQTAVAKELMCAQRKRQTLSFPILAVLPEAFPVFPEPAGQRAARLRHLQGGQGAAPAPAPCSGVPGAACHSLLPSLQLSSVLSATKSWQQPRSGSRVVAIIILCYFPVNSPHFTLSFIFCLSALLPLLVKPCNPLHPYQCPPRWTRWVGSCPWPQQCSVELYHFRSLLRSPSVKTDTIAVMAYHTSSN